MLASTSLCDQFEELDGKFEAGNLVTLKPYLALMLPILGVTRMLFVATKLLA
jgi:hypothetical protein